MNYLETIKKMIRYLKMQNNIRMKIQIIKRQIIKAQKHWVDFQIFHPTIILIKKNICFKLKVLC